MFRTYIRYLFTALLPIIGMVIFSSAVAAETLRVRLANSDEIKTLELAADETADVIIYLKSGGEMVGGYKIYIRRQAEQQAFEGQTSDDFGVATFRNVPAGDFIVFLKKTRKQQREDTVSLGDVVLKIGGKKLS